MIQFNSSGQAPFSGRKLLSPAAGFHGILWHGSKLEPAQDLGLDHNRMLETQGNHGYENVCLSPDLDTPAWYASSMELWKGMFFLCAFQLADASNLAKMRLPSPSSPQG